MQQELVTIGNMNETSKNILSYLLQRKRFRPTSNVVTYKVKLLQEGYKVNPVDYLKFWNELEKRGFGKLKDKIFTWTYNFRETNIPTVPAPKQTQDRLVFIPLLSGYDFEIKVPANLTDSDIKTITRALQKVKNKDID